MALFLPRIAQVKSRCIATATLLVLLTFPMPSYAATARAQQSVAVLRHISTHRIAVATVGGVLGAAGAGAGGVVNAASGLPGIGPLLSGTVGAVNDVTTKVCWIRHRTVPAMKHIRASSWPCERM